jgi:hypothetical protein
MRTCTKHTQYYVLGLLSFIAGHMINSSMHEILLPLWLCLIPCSRGCGSGWALPCKVASQTTLKTSSAITTSLSACILRCWSIREGALLHVLARWLLHSRLRCLMLRPLYLEARARCLKVQSLHQKLRVRHLHWRLRLVHLWWFEELVRL